MQSKNVYAIIVYNIFFVCVCVCVCECVDYIYVLFVVVYVVVSMCVYADTCATWQILGCLMNMCSVAICSGSCRTVGDLVG